MRAFISLNIAEEKQKEISIIQSKLKQSLGYADSGKIRWEACEKFHLTIFFLGEITNEKSEEIIYHLNEIPTSVNFNAINFLGNEISAFPDRKHPKVIIINLLNADNNLIQFYDLVCTVINKSGFNPDKKFHPHITLGRIRRNEHVNFLVSDQVKFDLNFQANEFYLMESTITQRGSVYSVIKSFPFK